MKKLAIGIGLAAIAAGCTTVYKNDGGDADLRPAIVRDVAYEKFDIKSTPVESVDSRKRILFFTIGGIAKHYADNAPGGYSDKAFDSYLLPNLVAESKNAAYAAACEAANCDTLVGSRYIIEHNNYFFWEEAKVKVIGYPAKLTGVEFRKANFNCGCGKK